METLIPMAYANVNQVTKGIDRTDWVIRENITEKELGRFPSKLTDKEAFAMLRLIRKYELEALNIGIQNGKERTVKVYDKQIVEYKRKFEIATKENERLAEILDKLTKGIN